MDLILDFYRPQLPLVGNNAATVHAILQNQWQMDLPFICRQVFYQYAYTAHMD